MDPPKPRSASEAEALDHAGHAAQAEAMLARTSLKGPARSMQNLMAANTHATLALYGLRKERDQARPPT